MRTAVVAFVVSMLVAAVLTPLIRNLAYRYGALDHALTARKIHGRPIPRLGGIAIVAGFYVSLLGLLIFKSGMARMLMREHNFALGIFAGGIVIAALGVYDDLRGADARKKFVVQFAVAGLMYSLGFRVEQIASPFGGALSLGWASLPFTLLWIVGVINAMNLIDGLDGLAGGVALVATATITIISLHNSQPLMVLFAGALAGSVLGFLFYNFNPASIFMGDTGSMFLGFVLATTSLRTNQKSSTAVALVVPAIVLGLPILDTLLAMGRRAIRGRPLFHADKDHIHHRLLATGLTHRQTVLVMYTATVLLSGTAVGITYSRSPALTVGLLAGLAILTTIALRRLGYIRFQVGEYLSEQRRRNRMLEASLRPHYESLKRATCLEQVWDAIRTAMVDVEAVGARFEVVYPGNTGNTSRVSLSVGWPEAEPDTVQSSRFVLAVVRADHCYVEFAWPDRPGEIDRDLEIAIERLCQAAANAVGRCIPPRATAISRKPTAE